RGRAAHGDAAVEVAYHLMALGVLVAPGCVTKTGVVSRPLVFEDGSVAEYIDCSPNRAFCEQEARRLCLGGFDVLASSRAGGDSPRMAAAQGTAIVVACRGRARVSRACGDRAGR